jgi:hypothetical protein
VSDSAQNHSTRAPAPASLATTWPFFFALFLAWCFVAVSHQSFWIDECWTAHFACQPSLQAMWHALLYWKFPEIQAPLYMVYIWSWQHLFGNSEWILRLAGVPWVASGATMLATAFPPRQPRLFVTALIVLNPFAWFYLNEARLYSMQLGIAMMVFASLVRLKDSQFEGERKVTTRLAAFGLSVVLLSASSVLGMVWASAACLAVPALVPWPILRLWLRRHPVLIICIAAALTPCAAYYLWTRMLGTHAADIGGTNLRTLSFVFYELLGFNGLGPGRLALRNAGFAALKPSLPLLGVYGVLVGILCLAAVLKLRREGSLGASLRLGLALCLPLALLLALILLGNFRLLGRHCTPATVLVIYLFTIGALHLWEIRRCWSYFVVGSFLLLSTVSCLQQRFALRHAKDDYRAATTAAKQLLQNGHSVWWNADFIGCNYYNLPAQTNAPAEGRAWVLFLPSRGFDKGLQEPDSVFVSKPDVFDAHGAIHDFLGQHGYIQSEQWPAFQLYTHPVRP